MIKWWVATAVVVGMLGSVGVVHAESAFPLDAGCFGGLPNPECTHHSDCEGSLCYQNRCDCNLGSCEGPTRREHCDDEGCFCENRPSCTDHTGCNDGVLCVEGSCNSAYVECVANPQLIERCEGELCHCERRPSCTAHTDCGGVLCNEGQCSNLTECPRGILEFCHTPDRCLCRRPGWACVSHAGCGNGLCVDLRCSGHITSCNTPPYQTFCGPHRGNRNRGRYVRIHSEPCLLGKTGRQSSTALV